MKVSEHILIINDHIGTILKYIQLLYAETQTMQKEGHFSNIYPEFQALHDVEVDISEFQAVLLEHPIIMKEIKKDDYT